MNIKDLKKKKINELNRIAKELNVEGASGMRKQDLIFAILQAQTEKNGLIFGEGVLEILPDGFGFLRAPDYNYLPRPRRHLHLSFPDTTVQPSNGGYHSRPDSSTKDTERYFAMLKVEPSYLGRGSVDVVGAGKVIIIRRPEFKAVRQDFENPLPKDEAVLLRLSLEGRWQRSDPVFSCRLAPSTYMPLQSCSAH